MTYCLIVSCAHVDVPLFTRSPTLVLLVFLTDGPGLVPTASNGGCIFGSSSYYLALLILGGLYQQLSKLLLMLQQWPTGI